MEKLVEGLKEYRSCDHIDNPYYLDVEYQVLCHNHPDYLLPVQIRDIDGSSCLLYEVSGMRSMEEELRKTPLTREEFQAFLKDFQKMIGILDRFMLDISQICFSPKEIFREVKGHYWWIYSPTRHEDLVKEIEKLFEWILSSIDYSNFDLVQFAYYSYWCVRNHPFSEETLQKCIDYQPEGVAAYRSGSYEDFFKEEKQAAPEPDSVQEIQPEPFPYEERRRSAPEAFLFEDQVPSEPQTGSSSIGSMIPEILCMAACGVMAIALAVFLLTGLQHNILMEMKYIYAGLIVGVLLSAFGALQLHRHRIMEEKGRRKDNSVKKEPLSPSYDYSWEEEGGTEVLGIRRNLLQPAFKSVEDGKVYVIRDFPFYIGSDPVLNQMVIDEPSVSRRHAAVIRGRQTGNYDLQDLRSTNGTWLDQSPLLYEKPIRLEIGSVVRFAVKSYEFVMMNETDYERC